MPELPRHTFWRISSGSRASKARDGGVSLDKKLIATAVDRHGREILNERGRPVSGKIPFSYLLNGAFCDTVTGFRLIHEPKSSGWVPSEEAKINSAEWFAEMVRHWAIGRLGAEQIAWMETWVTDVRTDHIPVPA
ncbi:hypothetical protein [Azospirillum brasilense]|uniref:hypothetical protein n=1 Tax=Azospirillum brasilense TaxID=192 RepID=UPI0011EE541C|nr:hypothetical protein [Azospirillum brasilense]